ncbi:hypothetical protein P7C73_g3309, partial [Tremellales sp. Uapishka_1]
MALVLRNNSDLVYLPDHGLVGDDGGQIRRVDVSHNLLGSEGTISLFRGLSQMRQRRNQTHVNEVWGLTEINLGCNSLGDEALDTILGYAKKDVCLRKLLVPVNEIRLENNLDSIVNSLNSSLLSDFSLTNNANLHPPSAARLFATLHNPNLHSLHLSACNLGPSLAGPIAEFLTSPRSRNLDVLELNANGFGVEGVRRIIGAIEKSNFTILQLGLFANDPRRMVQEADDGNIREQVGEDETVSLNYEVSERLPLLLQRNRLLTKRIKAAAGRVIAPARIILNARDLNEEEIARGVIRDIGLDSGSGRPRPFPLLELPPEVRLLIIKHCSRDPEAISENQYARLLVEAKDLARWKKVRSMGHGLGAEEAKEKWLEKGGWDKWEVA